MILLGYYFTNQPSFQNIYLHGLIRDSQGRKMSKSLGNVILAKDFYKKYGPNVLHYIFLNSNYNQIINFNETIIQQAIDYNQKIKNLLKRCMDYSYTIFLRKESEQSEWILLDF